MCEFHIKKKLRHLLEIEVCDGFCSSADPCQEMKKEVKKCPSCPKNACLEATDPYFYDGGDWYDSETQEIEVSYDEVKRYAENPYSEPISRKPNTN